MAGDPLHLHQHHAQHLSARWRFDAQQLLGREGEGGIFEQGCHIVDAIGQSDAFEIGLVFQLFFNAGMDITDMRRSARNHLAIQFKDNAQYAMSARMLRPHIDDHCLIVERIDLHALRHRRRRIQFTAIDSHYHLPSEIRVLWC